MLSNATTQRVGELVDALVVVNAPSAMALTVYPVYIQVPLLVATASSQQLADCESQVLGKPPWMHCWHVELLLVALRHVLVALPEPVDRHEARVSPA